MAIEFKNGIIVDSTGTVLDVQGTQGQLFSITDSLTGDLFSVSDISGVPILNVNSSGAVDIDGTLTISTIAAATTDTDKFLVSDSGVLKFRTGAELLSDIGAQASGSYLTDLGTAIVDADFSGASGFMKKSSSGTYALDTNTYSTATGVENSADVTDATNVAAAGAAMDTDFTAQGFMVRGASSGSYSIDTNTYITSQRAIDDSPTDGSTTTSISSNWAYDNVKTAVPTNAVFTDTVNSLIIGNGSNEAMAGDTSIPVDLTVSNAGTVHSNNYTDTQYGVATTSAAGLGPILPNPHGGKFLRGDGTYVVPSYTSISGLATESYADTAEADAITAAATAAGNAYVALAGSTMTGLLTLSGNPTSNNHAATKAYVDGAVIADTDTQDLTISGRTITLDRGGNVTVPAPTYASVTAKPATFAPIIGTTAATAMAGNTDIPSGNQILDWTANISETVIHSGNINFPTMYTHPNYATTNINTSGSTIIDSITTNGTGHITAMGTRTLALSDIGFSGNSAANCVLSAAQTLTNKIIDADNNTISDLVVSNLKASAVVLESEGISSNDNDTTIPTSAAVKDYVDNAVIADTDTQDLGISGNSVTLDRGGSADISTITAVASNTAKTSFPGFGTSNTTALRGDTSIPSISGLASTSYVDTAEADAITAAASAAAGLYVPSAGTTTIGGTKTFTGSLILNDSSGSSPTMRFMNTTSPTEDEVSIFCNTSGKMIFQQKLASVGSNVVQAKLDENGLDVINGIKINGTSVLPAVDEDAFGSNSSALVPTQQSVKAYVDNAVSSAGGGTMSNFTVRDDGNNDHQIDQGEFIKFDGVNCTFNRTTNPSTNDTTTPLIMTVTVPKGITANDFLICGSGIADNDFIKINGTTVEGRSASEVLSDIGAQASGSYAAALGSDDNYVTDAEKTIIGNTSGTNSGNVCTTNHTSAGYLTSIADNSIGTAQLAHQAAGQMISFNSTGVPAIVSNGAAGTVLTGNTNGAPSFAALDVPDNHITNARLASITKGSIIHGNGSGNPAYLAIGTTAGHVLTVGGTGQIEWAASTGGGSSYSLPAAASSTRGGVKIGYTENGKNYPVEVSSEQMYVNVPWTDTDTDTNTQRAAGNGMALDGNEMDLDIDSQTAVTSARRDTMFIIDDPNDTGANALKKLGLYNMMEDMTDGAQSYTGCLTTGTSSPSQANSRFNLSVKCDTSNGAIQTSSSGLQVKVRGDIGINANGLGLNEDITVVDTIYNTALHVGYASNHMHVDYSAATNSSGGEIRWYSSGVEIMALGYEGNLEVLDDVTADSQVLTSDRKLKKNIEPLNYGLNEVLKLKPVRYEWKESYKKGKGTMVGFVSQDVQEVIPEVINESKIIGTEETKLGIDYSKIVAVLTNAIQEQQKQIDELKKIVHGNTN